jgi:hypothetical protein
MEEEAGKGIQTTKTIIDTTIKSMTKKTTGRVAVRNEVDRDREVILARDRALLHRVKRNAGAISINAVEVEAAAVRLPAAEETKTTATRRTTTRKRAAEARTLDRHLLATTEVRIGPPLEMQTNAPQNM